MYAASVVNANASGPQTHSPQGQVTFLPPVTHDTSQVSVREQKKKKKEKNDEMGFISIDLQHFKAKTMPTHAQTQALYAQPSVQSFPEGGSGPASTQVDAPEEKSGELSQQIADKPASPADSHSCFTSDLPEHTASSHSAD